MKDLGIFQPIFLKRAAKDFFDEGERTFGVTEGTEVCLESHPPIMGHTMHASREAMATARWQKA